MAERSPKRRNLEEDGAELDSILNPARNYPRKRVAVACEVCRLRKTKCDSKRPCSFCTEAGIECVYRQNNNNGDKNSTSASDVLTRIEERLARVEDALRPGVSETASTPGSTTISNRRQSFETTVQPTRVFQRHESRRYFQHIVSVPHFDYSIRQTVGEAVTARPSIVSFQCPYYIQFETWDDTRVFFDEELEAEEKLHGIMEARCGKDLDMTARTVFQLQQNFVMNFLQWLPLLEVRAFAEHVEQAQKDDFSGKSLSDCLVMFALAVGSLDRNTHTPGNLTLEAEGEAVHPGLHYFHTGRQILDSLSRNSRRNITLLQSRILQACYYQLILRPLLAWDVVSEVARDCMHILSSDTLTRMPLKPQENFHRIFWICSVILHELEAVLKLHPIGFRQFHEVVPLPLTDHEDEGYYFFFAQASLRKLLTETLDIVGYRVGQVIYAPVVAAELSKQVDEWYAHLPPHVRFPINASPVFDLRKAFLRIQYLALHAVIFWPSVLQVLESGAGSSQTPIENLGIAQAEAKTCLENIQLVCLTTEELLMQSHLGLQFVIWASYASMCMALAMYRAPALSFIPETKNDVPIRKCFASLHHWKDQKLVSRALKRTKVHMLRLGISID